MNKLKICIPAIVLTLSSFAITSHGTNAAPKVQKPKTETVVKAANSKDSFEATNKIKESNKFGLTEGLISAAGAGLLLFLYNLHKKYINKLKDDPNGARNYLDMCGDNYLD